MLELIAKLSFWVDPPPQKKRINKYINTMESLKIDEIVVDLSWNLLSY